MKIKDLESSTVLLTAVILSTTLLTSNAYSDWGVGLSTDNKSINNISSTGKDHDITALLGLKYQGERFNMGKDGISYNFSNSEIYAIEALLDLKNRGFVAKDSKSFTGMSERKTSFDLGARIIAKTGFIGDAVFEVTKDVAASKGYEANIKFGGIEPHKSHWTGKRDIVVAAVAGLRYQDAKTVDYYYGVKGSEATATRGAYKAKSAITPYVGVEAQANLTPHVTLDGSLGVYKRAKSIRNSTITNDKKYDVGVNLGFSYWF